MPLVLILILVSCKGKDRFSLRHVFIFVSIALHFCIGCVFFILSFWVSCSRVFLSFCKFVSFGFSLDFFVMSFDLRPSFYNSVSVMMVCDTLFYFVFFRVSSSQRDEGNVAECGTCSICSRFYVKTSKLWNVICNFVWREQSKTVRAMATWVVVANVKCFLEQKRDLPFCNVTV